MYDIDLPLLESEGMLRLSERSFVSVCLKIIFKVSGRLPTNKSINMLMFQYEHLHILILECNSNAPIFAYLGLSLFLCFTIPDTHFKSYIDPFCLTLSYIHGICSRSLKTNKNMKNIYNCKECGKRRNSSASS